MSYEKQLLKWILPRSYAEISSVVVTLCSCSNVCSGMLGKSRRNRSGASLLFCHLSIFQLFPVFWPSIEVSWKLQCFIRQWSFWESSSGSIYTSPSNKKGNKREPIASILYSLSCLRRRLQPFYAFIFYRFLMYFLNVFICLLFIIYIFATF